MASTRRSTSTRAHAEHERRGGMRYVWPWLLAPALVALGALLHWQLAGDQPGASLTSAGLVVGAGYVSAMTWRYALPRGPVITAHAVGTAATAGAVLDAMFIFGVTKPLFWLVILAGSANAISWNVRRLEVIRGEGDKSTGTSAIKDAFGLSLRGKKVVDATAERATVELRMGDGQTVEDVRGQAAAIGSQVRTIRQGVTVTPGTYEGDVRVDFVFKDVLTETLPWPGPYAPGRSIAAGYELGMYQTRDRVKLYLSGNYEDNIAPGHIAIGGAPRTGKGVTAKILVAETGTRIDAWVALADTRKADQFLAPIRDAVGWYKDTPNGVRAMLRGFDRATKTRNWALGAAGFESWTPKAALPVDQGGIGMPAIVGFFEEFANYAGENISLLVDIAEACLSAGIFLVPSAQRWSADRIPTSFRSSVSQTLCFGMNDDVSAGMILSDTTLAAGVDPYEWKARYPGRFLAEGNGVDPRLYSTQAKGYLADNNQIASVIERYGIMPELDEWTLQGFGNAYKGGPVKATLLVPSTIRPPAVAADAPPDALTDAEDDESSEEDEYVIPKHADPEDQALSESVEPRVPLDVVEGLDLSPEPEPGERTIPPAERDATFAKILNGFAVRPIDNPKVFSMGELVNAWCDTLGDFQANQRPALTRRLNLLIDDDIVRRLRHGHYEIVGEVPTVPVPDSE